MSSSTYIHTYNTYKLQTQYIATYIYSYAHTLRLKNTYNHTTNNYTIATTATITITKQK